MVNSMTNTSTDLPMNGEKLNEVTSFNFLGAYLFMDGTSTAEVRKRIVMATAAMARLSSFGQAVPSASKEQAPHVHRCLHPTLRLRDLDASRGRRTHDTCI
ncbi:hypothetical protein DPMN_164004 [Dreissena polymorpha]|uniref:Uncharacterized protein n=1 Tax=Dreissena polymorpha TaxID=45954 RepID=A0A9D4EV17_DREPO|nr:hypothetical protein DPMN_164004 [Dreissena polymorpha]